MAPGGRDQRAVAAEGVAAAGSRPVWTATSVAAGRGATGAAAGVVAAAKCWRWEEPPTGRVWRAVATIAADPAADQVAKDGASYVLTVTGAGRSGGGSIGDGAAAPGVPAAAGNGCAGGCGGGG